MPTAPVDKALYPFRGVAYLLLAPALWPYVAIPILLTGAFAVAETLVLFIYGFAPTRAFIDGYVWAWLAYPIAAIVLLMAAYLLVMLFVGVVLGGARGYLFAKVLARQGRSLPDRSSTRASIVAEVRKALLRIGLWVVTLPLNFVPVVGTILFFLINGYFLAWDLLTGYFDAKGMDYAAQSAFLARERTALVLFGAAGLVLAMIPLLGFVCVFTNTVGAALWAADLEA